MKINVGLAFVGLLTVFGVDPALANCPVEFEFEAIEAAIQNADTCEQGINIARQCAFGSSADVRFAGVAGEKCLEEISAPLSCDRQAVLDDLLGQCQEQYADFDGTMYRSFAAFCQLEVIEGFHSALSGINPSDFGEQD